MGCIFAIGKNANGVLECRLSGQSKEPEGNLFERVCKAYLHRAPRGSVFLACIAVRECAYEMHEDGWIKVGEGLLAAYEAGLAAGLAQAASQTPPVADAEEEANEELLRHSF